MTSLPNFFFFYSSDSQFQDEPKVIATARGIFDHRGGLLESTETGVSVYVPAGALPEGKKQEIYFKVCQDNKYIPPLDSDGGEIILHFHLLSSCLLVIRPDLA